MPLLDAKWPGLLGSAGPREPADDDAAAAVSRVAIAVGNVLYDDLKRIESPFSVHSLVSSDRDYVQRGLRITRKSMTDRQPKRFLRMPARNSIPYL